MNAVVDSTDAVAVVPQQEATKTDTTTESKKVKFEWTDDRLRAMLRLRFQNAAIAEKLRTADTNLKKAKAWKRFAAELTGEIGVMITDKQLRDKYKKIKSEYKQYSQDVGRTGNQPPAHKEPRYMPILCEWLGGQSGISNTVLFDSNDATSDHEDENVEDSAAVPSSKRQKTESKAKARAGVSFLAQEMGSGMRAIATALESRHAAPDEVVQMLRDGQEESRAMNARILALQEKQNQLLELIAQSMKSK